MEKRKLLGSLAIGAVLGAGVAVALGGTPRAFTPPAAAVWEKGALCEDYAHEIESGGVFSAPATTCPHREHVLIYQSADSRGWGPHMLCKCPRPDGTPDEVWLKPDQRVRLRCSVARAAIDSTYSEANDRSYWCAR